jgi:hypothetical protein
VIVDQDEGREQDTVWLYLLVPASMLCCPQKVSCYYALYIPSAYVKKVGYISTAKYFLSAQVQPHHTILAEYAFAFARNPPLETNLDTKHLNEPYEMVRAPCVRSSCLER